MLSHHICIYSFHFNKYVGTTYIFFVCNKLSDLVFRKTKCNYLVGTISLKLFNAFISAFS
jgi:hypothetical protein